MIMTIIDMLVTITIMVTTMMTMVLPDRQGLSRC
jgi:hypothetical protein